MAFRVSKRVQAEPIKTKPKSALQPSKLVKDPPKPKAMISTAPILRRQVRNKVYTQNYLRKHKRYEHELIYDFQDLERVDDIEACRTAILDEAKTALHATQAELHESLEKMHLENATVQERISAQYSALTRPISEDQVETTFIRPDGTEITEVRQIGKRIEEFKAMVAKNEAELKQCWAEWEDVQGDIIQLGVDIFGPDEFDRRSGVPQNRSASCRSEMEKLDLDHKIFLERMRGEIGSLCQDAWESMQAAEQETDLQVKSQKRKLLAQLFEDDDY